MQSYNLSTKNNKRENINFVNTTRKNEKYLNISIRLKLFNYNLFLYQYK